MARLESARHVYYVPVEPETTFTELCCEDCGARVYLEGEYVREVSFAQKIPLEELIQRTNPTVRIDHAARLDLETRLLDVDEAMRFALICEPFHVLSSSMILRPDLSRVKIIAPLVIAAFLLVILVEVLEGQTSLIAAAAIAIAATTYWLMVRALKSGPKISPIIRALVPLQPSLREIKNAIADVEQTNEEVRGRYNAPRIYQGIRNARVYQTEGGVLRVQDDT